MSGREGGPVAILAGSGDLPLRLAERLARDGRPIRVMAFRGFASRALANRADAVVDLLDVGRITALLDAWSPSAVTLAGGLARPSAAALVGAYSALRNREEVAAIVARGDDNLLRGAIDLLERRGLRCLGVSDLAPDLLAAPGLLGAVRPSPEQRAMAVAGFRVLAALSPFDVGQAVVVSGERILAVEGPEGTDRMMARVRPRRSWTGRRGAPTGGVLVKGPKGGQDVRVDLPAIGPRTVAVAARVGLAGIAIAGRATVVLEREEAVALADRLGLFLLAQEADRG